MAQDLNSSISVVTTIPPALRTTTVTPSSGVDLAGFNAFAVVAIAGAITDGTHTFSIQHSDTANSGFANVPAGELSGTPGAISANTVTEIGYLGTKRYIRAVITTTGSPATGGTIGVVVVRGAARKEPV